MGRARNDRRSRLIEGKGEGKRGKKRSPGREKTRDFGRKEKIEGRGGRVN